MKNKWIFYLFVLIAVGLSVFGVIYVVNSMSTETHSFSSDGYALYSQMEQIIAIKNLKIILLSHQQMVM